MRKQEAGRGLPLKAVAHDLYLGKLEGNHNPRRGMPARDEAKGRAEDWGGQEGMEPRMNTNGHP